jgi:NAD(P)-dependent dehydrogenase (short-subunit alcohol dehydrogenase family)
MSIDRFHGRVAVITGAARGQGCSHALLGAEPDVVLANAGIGIMRPDDPRRAFRDQLDVNLTGVWNTVQAAAPRMIERAGVGRSCSPARRSA